MTKILVNIQRPAPLLPCFAEASRRRSGGAGGGQDKIHYPIPNLTPKPHEIQSPNDRLLSKGRN